MNINQSPWLRRTRRISACLIGAFVIFASVAAAQVNEDFESPIPVLVAEKGSSYALVANPDNWRGELPGMTVEAFLPGQRIVLFVTNLDLIGGEGANAFRIFATDANGKRFRFTIESLERLVKPRSVYALTLRILDPNGYNGQPVAGSDLALALSWRGNVSNPVRLGLGSRIRRTDNHPAIKPAAASSPQTPGTANATTFNTHDRKRFMEQAAFGPSRSLDNKIRRVGFRAWINEQFVTPYPTIPYQNAPLMPFDAAIGCGGPFGTNPDVNLCHIDKYSNFRNEQWLFREAFYGENQLHLRTKWALHQIWVVSGINGYHQRWMQEYIEILDRHAFGNYRNLMQEMTLSPLMGEYLDMIRSTRQNPNENYPRELLQLFSVGLYRLNQDGSLMLDGIGNRIDTYDQEKINQFTKVFTGWNRCDTGSDPRCANAVAGSPNFIDPMVVVGGNHDLTAKSLFSYPGAPNVVIAACPNCTTEPSRAAYANESLNRTLDNIFHHPNVGPYIGKLLIQHMVTSDPSPAYVGRVSAAFNNNGVGVRGDMKAVIRAVLLDPEARGGQKTDPAYGKLREPFQYLSNILRTFGTTASEPYEINGVVTPPPASCQNRSDGSLTWMPHDMGQPLWKPQSVFNYFPPDYVVPGTDILGPEFAVANSTTSFLRNNLSLIFSFDSWRFVRPTTAEPYPLENCGTSVDKSELLAWAATDQNGDVLIEGLNQRMMHGTMSVAMKNRIRQAINNLPFTIDARTKAAQAMYLVTSSSQYQVQR